MNIFINEYFEATSEKRNMKITYTNIFKTDRYLML